MKQILVPQKSNNLFLQSIGGIILIVFLFLLIFFGTKGIVYSDEGYILYGAQRILEGQIPYKDFHFAYTPVSLYATAGAFFLFGKSILAGRLLMILLSLATSFVLFSLLKMISKNLFITVYGVLLYIVWAPLHSNFPWPVLFSISLGITSLFFFIRAVENKQSYYFFLSGICTALVVLTKQNFGVVILLNYIIAFFFTSYVKKKECNKRFSLRMGFCYRFLWMLSYLDRFA
jgi:4-amino-4-deoxy-L-arabinose transferase-like glycosyltransferase